MKRIVFIGYTVPLAKVNDYTGVSIAGNKMQWNILRQLGMYSDIKLDSITIAPLAPFPRAKNISCRREELYLDDKVVSHQVPFLNIPILKQLSQILSVYREADKLIGKNDKNTIILGYNLFPQVGIPMRMLKKKHRSIELASVLADLPVDDKVKRNPFSKILRNAFDRSTIKSMKKCEKFIMLSENITKIYSGIKNYLVIDGGVNIVSCPQN